MWPPDPAAGVAAAVGGAGIGCIGCDEAVGWVGDVAGALLPKGAVLPAGAVLPVGAVLPGAPCPGRRAWYHGRCLGLFG